MSYTVPLPTHIDERLVESRLRYVLDPFFRGILETLKDNRMVFFPGYTKHGEEHIAGVLADIERLVPDDVWADPKLFTDADAACLVMAVMLHDLALLLREPGFQLLRSGAWPPDPSAIGSDRYGDRPWPDLWAEFVYEARHFDDAALKRIWGPLVEAKEERPPVRDLPEDFRKWTKYDCLIAGEFLRRHHARLAHEFALFGLPGVEPSTLPSPTELLRREAPEHQQLAELAGIVARSHGLDLRVATTDIRRMFPQRVRPEGTAPIFLMALLRVADYLQLKSDRAPVVLLQLEQPQSPASIAEWAKHRAVRDIDWATKDPKAIFVELSAWALTLPIHLQLSELFVNLQREMDVSAAVLREEYGQQPGLRDLRLSRTRVQSDLDIPSFVEGLPYVPGNTGFSTAGPELIDLLIEPLYGKHHEFAVRELMQNAVDAVRELRRYCELQSKIDVTQANLEADVVISFDTDAAGQLWCRVQDQGIGMTPETVRRFFLRAGVTFRSSPEWKDEFESEPGRSTVLRSGRFGIGAFAAFLLGDKIRVSTRHVTASFGVSFEAKLHQDPIVLTKDFDLPIGTTIEILVHAENARFASSNQEWDFYTMTDVTVVRFFKNKKLEQNYEVPNLNEDPIRPRWRRFDAEPFHSLDFHYIPPPASAAFRFHYPPFKPSFPKLCCNGIIINMSTDERSLNIPLPEPLIYEPVLSVHDPDGLLPLDLRRQEVRGKINEIFPGLGMHLLVDLIAYCLVVTPTQLESCNINVFRDHPGLIGRNRGSALYTKRGVAFNDPSLRARLPIHQYIATDYLNEYVRLKDGAWIMPHEMNVYFNRPRDGTYERPPSRPNLMAPDGTHSPFRAIVWLGPDREPIRDLLPHVHFETKSLNANIQTWTSPSAPEDTCFDLKAIAASGRSFGSKCALVLAVEWFTDSFAFSKSKVPEPRSFATLWQEIIGSGPIPFNHKKRMAQVEESRLWELVKPYLEAWQREFGNP